MIILALLVNHDDLSRLPVSWDCALIEKVFEDGV